MTNSNLSNGSIIAQNTSSFVPHPDSELKIKVQINKSLQSLTKPLASLIDRFNTPKNWITTDYTLSQFATFLAAGGTWRPSIKEGGNKKADITYIGTVALDFDVPDAFPEFHELNAYAAIQHTTLSHSADQPWKQRLIFVLDRPVDVETSETITKILLQQYPLADQGCFDAGRFYFGSNQPCLKVDNVTLPVDFLLETFPLEQKPKRGRGRPKKVVNEETQGEDNDGGKKAKKEENLTFCELIYKHIYQGRLESDINQLYCLFNHDFKNREPEQDFIITLVGSNPFSATNSSGTSFTVSEKEGQLPIWFDKSGSAKANKYSGTAGGSFLHYWYLLHPDFADSDQEFSSFPVFVSVFKYFNVRLPAQFKYEHFKEQLRKDLRYKLRYNRMGNVIEYGGKEIKEGLTSWASTELGISHLASDPLYQCVEAVAMENEYHPFLEALERLATVVNPDFDLWENLPDYLLGIPRTDEKYELYKVFLQKYFCAIYSRVKFPGIKYDVVLVFQGLQGTGKSTWFRNSVLGRKFFADSASLANDKDSIMIEQRAVLHELPEITAHFVRDIGHIRHAITQSEAQVRLPYGRAPKTIRRQSIFCATANETEILKDPQGNRRFQIIRISNDLRPDKALFKKVWATVHQLLSRFTEDNIEDLEEFLELPRELRDASAANNKEFETVDALEESIQAALRTPQFLDRPFKITELLAMIYPGNAAVNRGEQARVTNILRAQGYDRKQRRVNGEKNYFWEKLEALELAKPEEIEQSATVPTEDTLQPVLEAIEETIKALPPSTAEVVQIPELMEETPTTVPKPKIIVNEDGLELEVIETERTYRKPGQKRSNVTLDSD